MTKYNITPMNFFNVSTSWAKLRLIINNQGCYFPRNILQIHHINVVNISNDIRAILTLTITNLGWQFQRQTPQFFWSRSVFQHITIPSSILTGLLWVKQVSSSRSSCQITKTTRSLGAFWAVASMWLAGRLLLTQTNTYLQWPIQLIHT